MEASQVHAVAREILARRCAEAYVHNLLSTINSSGGRSVLFAGAVRDAVYSALTGTSTLPRDYDIGVAKMSRSHFDGFCRALGAERNRYGGYQFYASDGSAIDIWRLEDTAGVLAHDCSPSVDNVLRTFIFDVNAVAYDPSANEIYDRGCLNALRRRRIGFVRSALLHDQRNFAGRAISLRVRFGFRLSRALRSFVAEWYDGKEVDRHLAKAQFSYSLPWSSPDPATTTGVPGMSSRFCE